MFLLALIFILMSGTAAIDLAQVTKAKYHFLSQDRLLAGLNYAHIAIPIKFDNLEHKKEKVTKILNYCAPVKLSVRKKSIYRKLSEREALCLISEAEASSAIKYHDELIAKLAAHADILVPAHPERNRRFLATLAVLGAIGISVISGLFSQSQISALSAASRHLSSRQDFLIHQTGVLTKQMESNAINIDTLHDRLRLEKSAMIYHHLIMDFRTDLSLLDHAFQSAVNHRISHHLLDLNTSSIALADLKIKVEQKGFELLISSALQLLQLPISFDVCNTTITLLIHVPIARPGSNLYLYQYQPFPFPLQNNMAATVTTEFPYLAINEQQTFYRELSKAELNRCDHKADVYICPHIFEMTPITVTSCTLALFLGQSANILKYCTVSVHTERNFYTVLTADTYHTYNINITSYNLTCFNGTVLNVPLSKIQIIKIPDNCIVDLPYIRFLAHTHGTNVLTGYTERSWDIEVDDVLGNLTSEMTNDMFALNQWDNEWSKPIPAPKLEHFQKQLEMEKSNPWKFNLSHLSIAGFFSSTGAIIFCIILLITIIFVYCRCTKSRK